MVHASGLLFLAIALNIYNVHANLWLQHEHQVNSRGNHKPSPIYATTINNHFSVNATVRHSKSIECRCGMFQFLSLPHANITPPEQALQCAAYKLLDARGTGEPQGVSTMFSIMVESVLANVTGGVSQPVEYPAGFDQNTTSGEIFVVETITKALRDCPGQKHALFGYSQGATVMLNALNQLSGAAMSSVKSVILVGNPYRIPGKVSNVNSTAQNNNDLSVGIFAAQAIADNRTFPQLSRELDQSGKVLDYCLEGDGVCSPDVSCSCQLFAGHLSYGLAETIQTTAFEHVVKQLDLA
ncbi:cutinase-domain-containing protein [Bisporella sp. PMI_857]|nr:cutinase-domain-containing protein [Bisporella sp. PMI_857]